MDQLNDYQAENSKHGHVAVSSQLTAFNGQKTQGVCGQDTLGNRVAVIPYGDRHFPFHTQRASTAAYIHKRGRQVNVHAKAQCDSWVKKAVLQKMSFVAEPQQSKASTVISILLNYYCIYYIDI